MVILKNCCAFICLKGSTAYCFLFGIKQRSKKDTLQDYRDKDAAYDKQSNDKGKLH